MSSSERAPESPGEFSDGQHSLDVVTPTSPDSDELGELNTDASQANKTAELPKRLPSLRSVSDPRNLNLNSTALGILGKARNPNFAASSFAGRAGGALETDVMAKARALHQQRMQMGMSPVTSPSSPSVSAGSNSSNGFPLRLPPSATRPGPGVHHNSAPTLGKPSLSERRANKLGGMKLSEMGTSATGTPNGPRRVNAPKLSDITGDLTKTEGASCSSGQGSKLDDFKQYIDAEKGWITFDGAATITRTGVNFSNGQTFSISLDEIETLDELGKGNYGTVYKVKHAKPTVPRFGHGLSGLKSSAISRMDSMNSVNSEISDSQHGTTGKVMAMKEIRLELDDAKFTTILKELVILHECVSPHIIEFYGAFFQEGAVYICIEYMDGGSIDKLYTGGIPETVLRKITISTVLGLKSLKDDHNIIHRDVKPTNILVNTQGQIKICDFGVSGNLVASIAKTNIGCQSYMAPERIAGGGMAQAGGTDGTYSVQSDIWSLGLTIIECAMGRYPYPPEVSSTIFSQLSAIVEGEPPSLPEGHYSEAAQDFVQSCVRKVPKMRPTYALLLKSPWLSPLSMPPTIVEEAEDGDGAAEATEALANMTIGPGTGDHEVATWVKAVLQRKRDGILPDGPSKPALHAAPLDTVSPVSSPDIQ